MARPTRKRRPRDNRPPQRVSPGGSSPPGRELALDIGCWPSYARTSPRTTDEGPRQPGRQLGVVKFQSTTAGRPPGLQCVAPWIGDLGFGFGLRFANLNMNWDANLEPNRARGGECGRRQSAASNLFAASACGRAHCTGEPAARTACSCQRTQSPLHAVPEKLTAALPHRCTGAEAQSSARTGCPPAPLLRGPTAPPPPFGHLHQ